MHNIYADDRSALDGYSWDPQAHKLVRAFNISRWVLAAITLLLVLCTFWWGSSTLVDGGLEVTGVVVILFSAFLMGVGARLALFRTLRNRVIQQSPRTRHDWNLYLYHRRLHNRPNKQNRVLLLLASADVQDGRYDLALQALSEIDTSGFTGEQLKYSYLLELVATAYGTRQTEAAKIWYERYLGIPVSSTNAVKSEGIKSGVRYRHNAEQTGGYTWVFPSPEVVRSWILGETPESEIRATIGHVIPLEQRSAFAPLFFCGMLAHCTFFTGVWLGITNSWHLRIHYLEIAGLLDALFITVLVIWILVYRYRHQRKAPQGGRRAATILLRIVVVAAALFISAAIGKGVTFDSDASERTIATGVADSASGKTYDYLAVHWNAPYGNEGADSYYRTRDFILMESWPAAATYDHAGDNTPSPESADASSGIGASSEPTSTISDSQGYSAAVQNEIQAVYLYLQSQNALNNMSLSFQADAKGNTYAVVSTGSEDRNGASIAYEYRLYDNGEQVSNGVVQEEIVLEKCYPDGEVDTETEGFYLVDLVDLTVTDEHKTSW